MHEVYELMGLKKTRTTAYHPQSDGLVERQNRTLQEILSTFIVEHQADWDEMLDQAVFAYNTSVHESTKVSNGNLNQLIRVISEQVKMLTREPSYTLRARYVIDMLAVSGWDTLMTGDKYVSTKRSGDKNVEVKGEVSGHTLYVILGSALGIPVGIKTYFSQVIYNLKHPSRGVDFYGRSAGKMTWHSAEDNIIALMIVERIYNKTMVKALRHIDVAVKY